jgi:uncharacterized protein (TIGR02099 family)
VPGRSDVPGRSSRPDISGLFFGSSLLNTENKHLDDGRGGARRGPADRRCAGRYVGRAAGIVAGLVVLAGAAVLVATTVLLPDLAARKQDVEDFLSRKAHVQVEVGSLAPHWDFLHPGLLARDVRVRGAGAAVPAIGFDEVRVSAAWWPLLRRKLELHRLVVVGPRLSFERLADGTLRVRGLDAFEGASPAEQEAAVRAIFRVRDIAIEDGEFRWHDQRAAEPPLALTGVHLRLRNRGERHRFEIGAHFPDRLCRDCEVSGDLRGNPFGEERSWRGKLAARANQIDLDHLPRVIREVLPEGFRGRLGLNATSEWRDGRPVRFEGKVNVNNLFLPLPGLAPIEGREAETFVRWKAWDEFRRWRLELNDLKIGISHAAWNAGKLKLIREPENTALSVDHVRLDDLATLAGRYPAAHASMPAIQALSPGGQLDDVAISFAGPLDTPQAWSLHATLRDLTWHPWKRIPGAEKVSGTIRMDEQGGEVSLLTGRGLLDMPKVFAAPVEYRRLTGQASWQRTPAAWEIRFENVSALTPDGRAWGSGSIEVPHAAPSAPILRLRAGVSDANGTHAARYYPLILSPGLRGWLANAIKAAKVTRAQVIFDGPVRAFPFRRGEGEFEVSFHVRDGVFEYLRKWPLLEGIETDVTFRNHALAISASRAQIRGLSVGPVAVTIPDLGAHEATVVQIGGQARGTFEALLTALSSADLGRHAKQLTPGMRGTGNGELTLGIAFPAGDPAALRLNATYRLTNGGLRDAARHLDVQAINGSLDFSEIGPIGGELTGRALGGNFRIQFQPPAIAEPAARGRVVASGTATTAGIAPWLGGFDKFLHGSIPWQLTMTPGDSGFELSLDADLARVQFDLPPPLAKPANESMRLRLAMTSPTPDTRDTSVSAGTALSAVVRHVRSAGGPFEWERAHVALGESATMPDAAGMRFSVRAAALDVAPWKRLRKDAAEPTAAGSGELMPRYLTQVGAHIGKLQYGRAQLGQFDLDIGRQGPNWAGRISGDVATGAVEIRGGERQPAIVARLDRLAIPAATEEKPAAEVPDQGASSPADMPAINLSSPKFIWRERPIGGIEIAAKPAGNTLQIESLRISNPKYSIDTRGEWSADAGPGHTRFITKIAASDLGAFLDAMGYPGRVLGGQLDIDSEWNWPGAPADFALAQVGGRLDLRAKAGKLPAIGTGAGRLLGTLDLRSLPRYLALDFSSIFGKGFAFDSIVATAAIANGNAQLQSAVMKGPPADVVLHGRIGLSARDYGLEMQITPRIGEAPTIAGALLGGPVGAAAVFVTKGILRKPIEAGTRLTYDVTGTWDNPVVARRNNGGGLNLDANPPPNATSSPATQN